MFTTEPGRDGALFEGVEDGVANRAKMSVLWLNGLDLNRNGLAVMGARRGVARITGDDTMHGTWATYGGRKNCSSTTYMPRNISANRKYLVALSSELSVG